LEEVGRGRRKEWKLQLDIGCSTSILQKVFDDGSLSLPLGSFFGRNLLSYEGPIDGPNTGARESGLSKKPGWSNDPMKSSASNAAR